MIVPHRRRAARNFATSSSRSMWALKKNEICGAIESTSRPRATASSTYAIPFARVNPISCTAVAPASRMWYPLTLIAFHRGTSREQNSLASSEGRIAVVSHLRRQVEGHTQALVAMLEEIPESPVRLLRGPEARVLAHRPEAAAVHRGPRAAGEGWLAREPERLREVRGRAMGRRHDDVQGEVAARFARRGQWGRSSLFALRARPRTLLPCRHGPSDVGPTDLRG